MAVIALIAGKGSPGVTVSGLALTFAWPHPVVLAEADPAGGDIRHGYLRSVDLPGDIGLMPVAIAELRGTAPDQLWHNLVDLDGPRRTRRLLPGLTHAGQAPSLEPVWEGLAGLFHSLAATAPGYDVIVDCGRLTTPHAPWPILRRADAVLVVARPTAASIASTSHALAAIRADLRQRGAGDRPLALLLTGEGDYQPREIERHLTSGDGFTPEVVAALPHDPKSAAVLSFGGNLYKRGLLRAAIGAARAVRDRAAQVQALLHHSVAAEATHE